MQKDEQRGAVSIWILVAVGAVLLLVTICETLIRLSRQQPLSGSFLAAVLTNAPIHLGIIYCVCRNQDSTSLTQYAPQIVRWSLAGGALLGLLIGLFVPALYESPLEYVAAIRWAVSVGIGGGFLAGFFNARITTQRVATERAAIRAEEAKERQELLEYLNALLRHEVLNSANVVHGWAGVVESEIGDGHDLARHLRVIQRQTEDISDIVNDVQVLLRANERSIDSTVSNVIDAVEGPALKLNERHDDIEVELDLPAAAGVRMNSLLPRAFENLYRNAIEHNNAPKAELRIASTVTDQDITITIEDNGPGIPEDLRHGLFSTSIDRADDQTRLGGVIVGRLIRQHEGQIEIADTGTTGTSISVVLPLASA